MSFDVEKVNSLLKKDNFVNKLKADLSDEGIVKTFGSEGISLTKEDAIEFKQTISTKYELEEDNLNVSGGKMGIEQGVHDTFEGVGTVIGGFVKGAKDVAVGTAKGVKDVAVGTAKGVGKSAWGLIQIPGSVVRDIGVGVYSGIKDSITEKK